MASKSLGTLTLDLVAKIGGFTGPLDKAGRHAKKTSDEIGKYGKAMGLAVAAGAIAAAAGVAMIVNRQRELIDQQAKAAQQLDTTYTSMANLERAGELGGVGMEKISAASRQMNINIGKAIAGAEAQERAFSRLGLSAQEIADVPLDQRISKINQALRDNVQASERAAVAADLFGAEGATAIQQLSPETIAEAARQVEIFGLNLSDVDAAKVEMANDAMSTFGMLSDGAAKQLTVELAPILKAVGELFLQSAEEAGGMGNAVRDAVAVAVDALAFVMDAADGVKRAFQVVADIIVATMAVAAKTALDYINNITDGLNLIPGVEIDNAEMKASAREAWDIAKQAAENIEKTLDEPLAGTKFKQFVAEAQAAGQIAAEEAVKTRAAARATGEAFVEVEKEKTKAARKTIDQVGQQITALERAAKTWGMSADEVAIYDLTLKGATREQLKHARSLLDTVSALEQQKKQQEDYKSLVQTLRTEEERRLDTLKGQFAVLDAMQGLSEEERANTAGRIAAAGFSDAPSFAGISPEIGGPMGELDKLDKARKEQEKWYEEQLEMLATYRAERQDLDAEWNEQELDLQTLHAQNLAAIDQARKQVAFTAASEAFAGLADLTKAFAGEQSAAYKTMFAASKAFALAQAAVKIGQGIATAVSEPWPLNIAAVASTIALAGGMISDIQSVNLTGQAHDGIDSVPATGTWLLEKGERVTTAETSAKLDNTLARIQAGMNGDAGQSSRRGPMVVNQTNHYKGQGDNRTAAQANNDLARKMRTTQARLG